MADCRSMVRFFRTFILLPAIAAAGCATVPPTKVAQFQSSKDVTATTAMIDLQARNCWQADANILKNGVTIKSNNSNKDEGRVSAVRYSVHDGMLQEFVIVDVTSAAEGSSVSVFEGEYECEIGFGCYEKNFAVDVPRWLAGDLTCKKNPRIPVPKSPSAS